jgi:hypothetical protein
LLLCLRKQGIPEDQIVNRLKELGKNQARDAYALFELVANKQKIDKESTGEKEKRTLISRSDDILEMLLQTDVRSNENKIANIETLAASLDKDDPNIETCAENADKVFKNMVFAKECKKNFDIEKADIHIPEEYQHMFEAYNNENSRIMGTQEGSEKKADDVAGKGNITVNDVAKMSQMVGSRYEDVRRVTGEISEIVNAQRGNEQSNSVPTQSKKDPIEGEEQTL